ncbi:MAG TPA: hypothetical protein VJZ00_17905, partial [Thermoanaerobaculia bacterium]|nr:hypothetical protein [Thermoanaerobaculia bacterium]
MGATLLLNQTCNTRSPVPESFVAAIVRSDRILETRSSADGVAWSGSHLHTDLGRMDYGPGLASDASGALVFLAAFGKTNSGSTKLFVRAGLGDHWETDFPNQIVVSTASAPAICPLDDHHFFIAWNSGARGIATAILDTQRAGHPDSVTRLPDINDALAADIEGAPSVAVSGTRVLIVWRRHPRNDAASLAANRATYRSADASVEFGTSRGLSVTPS